MTSISDELLSDFVELYREHFGITLDRASAAELAESLVGLVALTQRGAASMPHQSETEEGNEN